MYGLPSGWKISELSNWDPTGLITYSTTYFSDPSCYFPAFTYQFSFQGYLGEETTPRDVFGPGWRIREMATQYLTKTVGSPTEAGIHFLNSTCPGAGWLLGTSKNLINTTCLPFVSGCNPSHYVYIQAGLTAEGNLVRYSIDPKQGSCSVANYSYSPFLKSTPPPIPYVVYRDSAIRGQEVSLFFLIAAILLSYLGM